MKQFGLMLFVVPAVLASLEALPRIIASDTGVAPKKDEYGGCSLACGLAWDVTASSSHEGEGLNKYAVSNLEDFDIDTAWIEGKPDYGIGELISFHFSKELWARERSQAGIQANEKINFNGC